MLFRLISLLWAALLTMLCAAPASATSMYDTVLTPALMSGPDLCAEAPCSEVLPAATAFSKRKGAPSYVEGYALEQGKQRLVGYVFLSTDVVDIPAYSGKPVVTLIGMDTKGVISGVRILKHSEPILLAGIPETVLTKFVRQYFGKPGDAKLELGLGRDGGDLDAISGATVTAIAENQTIAQSAYEIGKQVGIFKGMTKPRAHFTPLRERLDWAALVKEGAVRHLRVEAEEVGLPSNGKPYMDLHFGYLNVPTLGISLLGERNYTRLMADLKEDEHAIFIIGTGLDSFKGSGFVRGGIYDRIQVRQDTDRFTFRDTDYLNLYHLEPAGAPAYRNRRSSSCARRTSIPPGRGN
jgi:NosR/NirI family nitrous oxide reductase transcriptional regulator